MTRTEKAKRDCAIIVPDDMEYGAPVSGAYNKGVEAGVEWSDSHPNWIDINEQRPPLGVEVNAYSKEWIDEDFNPNGTRAGFMTDHGFYSAFWWDYQDCYMTISKDEVDSNREFYESHIGKTEPTHWMPIVPPKFD